MENKTIASKFKITNDEEYQNAKELFVKFAQEANGIVDFLSCPKNNEKIILAKDEKINSDYLNNLGNKLDELGDSLLDYNKSHPELYDYGTVLVLGDGPNGVDLRRSLKMYEFYLRDRKNPETLNIIELKNIESIPVHPYYSTSSKKNFGLWGKIFGV